MKGKTNIKTINEYFKTLPADVRERLEKMRETIQKAAPQTKEAIKYGIPIFVLGKNLVHFAAFKNHIGFYPAPSAITAFQKELKPYRQAKGSVQFPTKQKLPLVLIKKIVMFWVKENQIKISGGK